MTIYGNIFDMDIYSGQLYVSMDALDSGYHMDINRNTVDEEYDNYSYYA